ncbi:polyprenyl synthetase family protein [Salinarchaeum sp. IM2453]|uniref:polyprenyl synthetase family protein n=1 Tax=Salinarchaeum sp. IM2453 TaxID=2862870 RepID=UPI001C8386B1|nr:polyprenyl synthetase family protein [Salinarchaeum sp. IM2453]QZA87424.1 polyprenyl synthetase family protein [Salinarchaeum sp. IM2453]
MELLDYRRNLVESRLEEVIDEIEHEELATEMRHVTLSGGKRVRPMLTLFCCEAAGGDPEKAIDFAVGIELVHTASLVIDDIIDESEIRRGVDSAWIEFGYGPAIIASDGLLGEAFALFQSDPRATRIVAEAMVDLGEGEAMELADRPVNKSEYRDLARRKTGALFRAAAELGGVAADASPKTIDALGEYAERVGIAFQIRDDVLDSIAETEKLGKPTGIDADMDRPSIVHVTELSANEADAYAQQESRKAVEALTRANLQNEQAEQYLRDLAEFVVQRER